MLTSSKTVLIRRTQEWCDNGQFDNPELVRRIWDLLDGTQNLEERVDGVDRIDPVVLEQLRQV